MYSYTLAKDSVTVCMKGEVHTVMRQHPHYLSVLDALRAKQWDRLPGLLEPAQAVNTISNGNFRIDEGQVFVKCGDGTEFKCPSDLSEQILLFMEQSLDFMPLVEFARKLSQNPSYRSVNQLFGWIKTAHLTICENGNFIAYKGVRKDMTDCHTGTMDNSVGNTVKMKRNEVDEDPMHSCSAGLHVANYNYAHAYYGGGYGRATIMVEVNPKDVVAVPQGEYDKMRVCEYKVLSISEGPVEDTVYRHEEEEDEEEAPITDRTPYSHEDLEESIETSDWVDSTQE